MSPALAGGFLTTAPPGKSGKTYFQIPVLGQSMELAQVSHKAEPGRCLEEQGPSLWTCLAF